MNRSISWDKCKTWVCSTKKWSATTINYVLDRFFQFQKRFDTSYMYVINISYNDFEWILQYPPCFRAFVLKRGFFLFPNEFGMKFHYEKMHYFSNKLHDSMHWDYKILPVVVRTWFVLFIAMKSEAKGRFLGPKRVQIGFTCEKVCFPDMFLLKRRTY